MDNKIIKEKIKDIAHKSSDNDIRGACGEPCYACWRTEKTIEVFEKALSQQKQDIMEEIEKEVAEIGYCDGNPDTCQCTTEMIKNINVGKEDVVNQVKIIIDTLKNEG